MINLIEKLETMLKGIEADARAYREHIHCHPELSWREHETTKYIERLLKEWGYEPFHPPGVATGAVAVLEGKASSNSSRVVALRADIDALPITEETGASYASKERGKFKGEDVGVMHACGHDGHTAVLLGAARALKEIEADLPGTIKFIFQPAEEGGAGGQAMVKGGVLKNPDVDAIFALHCRHTIPLNFIELAETPNAAADGFEIEVVGDGGHGGYPHSTVDPIPIAAQIVTGLQTIVSRKVTPGRPAVVTVGSFQAGTARNVIPDTAKLLGTIRTLDPETRELVHESIKTMATSTAEAAGAKANVTVSDGYPPVRCDRRLIELVRGVAAKTFGQDRVRDQLDQTMGGEDFSYYLEDQGGVPGVIFRLGVTCEENPHTSRFDFGSDAVLPGMRMMSRVALAYLSGEADA